jgi:hypothetical protein
LDPRGKLTLHSAAALALCLVPVLSGCGTPPWKEAKATPTPTDSVTVTPTPTPTPTKSTVKNDLAKGSAKHQLGAGGLRATVNYWSTLEMGRWTPQATKPLNLSITAAFGDGSKQDIFLNNVTLTTDVNGPEGALVSPDPLSDAASTPPGYLVTSPNSYVKVFNIPRLEDAATSATLTLTYEFLAQSKPKSHTYLKQSTSDTLVVALVAK